MIGYAAFSDIEVEHLARPIKHRPYMAPLEWYRVDLPAPLACNREIEGLSVLAELRTRLSSARAHIRGYPRPCRAVEPLGEVPYLAVHRDSPDFRVGGERTFLNSLMAERRETLPARLPVEPANCRVVP